MRDSPEDKSSKQTESPVPESARPSDGDRRAALAQMGRYAAYTAPALLALLIGSKAHAAS